MPLQTQNALLVPVFDGRLLSLKTNSNVATAIFTADFSLRTSPVALENDVVVTAENGGVLRLAQNGKIVWQWRANVSVSTRPLVVRVLDVASQSSMTQSETSLKMLVVGDDNGEVTALNARDGKVVWTQKTGAPIGNALAASSDGKWVFVPLSGDLRNRGAVVCLNAQSGTVRWTKEVGASCVAAPVVGATSAQGRDERVFLCADNGSVLCLDKSGKSVWKTFVRPLPNAKNDEAIVLRGESLLKLYGWGARLFVGGNDGVLRCLDARSGRELWNFETGAPLLQRAFSLQIAQNDAARAAILVGAKTRLCALDAKSGALLWSAPTQDEIAFWSARDKTAWSVSRAGVAERFSLP